MRAVLNMRASSHESYKTVTKLSVNPRAPGSAANILSTDPIAQSTIDRGHTRCTILLLAFHFPPFKGSSGLERTLGFCRDLPRFGWLPVVLTASTQAYESVSQERVGDIPAGVIVERAFAMDTARHLSIGGRYPRWAALPDRWISWLVGAVPMGWRLARRHRPAAIWSTYPIATAHVAGYMLARITGLPWVADFRDPMVEFDASTQTHYPTDARVRSARLWVEGLAARRAAMAVFCTRGAAEIFALRYPKIGPDRIHVIANGYDENAFSNASAVAANDSGRLVLVHSGTLYPGPDRDPTAFFQALRALLDADPKWSTRVRIVLRASGFDTTYQPIIDRLRLQDCVVLSPSCPYREALGEMLSADGLLVFQGHTSNPAIPAKLYEYLRARRPILALVDAQGSTAALLREEGVGVLAPIDDVAQIQASLREFLIAVEAGQGTVLSKARVQHFERGERAAELARLLDKVTNTQRPNARG